MDVGTLALFVGTVLAILGIMIAFFLQLLNILQRVEKRQNEHTIAAAQAAAFPDILPPGHIILMSLARGATFWQRLFLRIDDKARIASTIAKQYVDKGQTILLDSGTTVDQIPQMLPTSGDNSVYTNNLLAAIGTVHQTGRRKCHLLAGKIDSTYGATYPVRNGHSELDELNANVIVLSATAISFDKGPLVRADDHSNMNFKRTLVDKALNDGVEPVLLIACDWTKFVVPREDFNPVLAPEVWNAVRTNARFFLITTEPKQTPDIEKKFVKKATEEIKRFEKAHGIQTIFA